MGDMVKNKGNFTFTRFPKLFKAWSYSGYNLHVYNQSIM